MRSEVKAPGPVLTRKRWTADSGWPACASACLTSVRASREACAPPCTPSRSRAPSAISGMAAPDRSSPASATVQSSHSMDRARLREFIPRFYRLAQPARCPGLPRLPCSYPGQPGVSDCGHQTGRRFRMLTFSGRIALFGAISCRSAIWCRRRLLRLGDAPATGIPTVGANNATCRHARQGVASLCFLKQIQELPRAPPTGNPPVIRPECGGVTNICTCFRLSLSLTGLTGSDGVLESTKSEFLQTL